MNKIQLSRETFSKKFLTAFTIASLFSAGSMNAFAGVWTVNATHSVNEQQQQVITLKGTVVDSKGEPVIGASVLEKGSSRNGAITDIDGKFSLKVKPSATLVISYIGFQKQEVPVSGKTSINIVLKDNAELLQEVVVVGYGTQKKENLTGAVVSVDIDKSLKNRPIADVGRGLQGSVPGLSIVIGNGEVGSDPTMKIRGQLASINGSNNPLILLDNVEIPSIQMVNPDDIESISVLKDAAASSIYGAKAAFGVVLITSKKGAKSEAVNVQYSDNFSWQHVAKDINMAGIDALDYTVDAMQRVGSTVAGAFWYVTPDSYKQALQWQQTYGGKVKADDPVVYGRDWYVDSSNRKIGLRTYNPVDYMVKDWSPTETHNLSISGKSKSTTYNIGLGYLDQNGMTKPAKHDDFRRYNASLRLSTDINKYITVRAGALYSKRIKRYAYATSSTTADTWYYLYRWGPLQPFGTTEEGDPIRSPASEVAQSNTADQTYNYTNVNLGATIHLSKDWTIDADYTHANQDYAWNRPGTLFTAANSWGGAAARYDSNGSRIYVDNTGQVVDASAAGAMPAYQLSNVTYTAAGTNPDHIYRNAENMTQETANVYTTYNLKIGSDHAFKAMAGINRVTQITVNNWSQITQLLDINNPQFGLTTGTQTSGGATYWESQLGYFGRLNYAFKDRYLLEGNIRYDGSSKFPSNLQWRWFPSFSAGWRASEESFMEWTKPALSSLKFRGSWGKIGDQTVPNNLYVATMGVSQTNWLNGSTKFLATGTPAAVQASITWQDIQTLDFGADFRMFNNELGISLDWYQRSTNNMLVPGATVANTYGTTAPIGNYGNLRTRGWEIAIDYNHRFSNGVGLNVVATLSDAKTVITKYQPGAVRTVNGYYEGATYGEIWGYKTDRLYQKDDFELDANGNPQLITLTANESAKYAGKKAYKLKTVNGVKPVYQPYLQNSSDFYFGPGDVKFVDQNGDGEINNGSNTVDDHGDLSVIGNSTPRYEYGFRLGSDWKGFDCSIFFQGVGQRDLWGSGALTIPGFNTGDGAMAEAIANNFWKDSRTDAFYPRAYNQANSNTTNNMQMQSRYLLNMAYMRIKNITLGYTLPHNLLSKASLSKARIYASLENFFTFDHLHGLPIDPEVVSGYSMFNTTNYNSGRTGEGTPLFKSVSFGVQIDF